MTIIFILYTDIVRVNIHNRALITFVFINLVEELSRNILH